MINWDAPRAILTALFSLVLVVVGLSILGMAKKGRMSEVASTVVIAFIAIAVVGIGLTVTNWGDLGSSIATFFGINVGGGAEAGE